MALIIGIDEAGYGPNLGPLAIGLTAWQVESTRSESPSLASSPFESPSPLYELLDQVVSRQPTNDRIAIADSKTLYKPGGGLQTLELGVLASLNATGVAPKSWSELLDALAADEQNVRRELPWHEEYDPPAPVECSRDEIDSHATRLLELASPAGVRPLGMRARLVFPREFNELTERYDSKGAALSHLSMRLLAATLDTQTLSAHTTAPSPQPPAPIFVTCDKHGGRSKYAPLLVEHFPDCLVTTMVESRPVSKYRLDYRGTPLEIQFRTKGEEHLETALASMIAKYLRELSMRAFNQFWAEQVPGIKPTAGYPVDAKRFKKLIAEKQKELNIDDQLLWRRR